MPASKGPKPGTNRLHKHLHSRVSYLHQAARYLSGARDPREQIRPNTAQLVSEGSSDKLAAETQPANSTIIESRESQRLLSQLRGVSLRSQIRLTPRLKHTICKRCNMILISGTTSSEAIENASRGGKKPWADVFVVGCRYCGTKKRFPLGAKTEKCSHSERAYESTNGGKIQA